MTVARSRLAPHARDAGPARVNSLTRGPAAPGSPDERRQGHRWTSWQPPAASCPHHRGRTRPTRPGPPARSLASAPNAGGTTAAGYVVEPWRDKHTPLGQSEKEEPVGLDPAGRVTGRGGSSGGRSGRGSSFSRADAGKKTSGAGGLSSEGKDRTEGPRRQADAESQSTSSAVAGSVTPRPIRRRPAERRTDTSQPQASCQATLNSQVGKACAGADRGAGAGLGLP